MSEPIFNIPRKEAIMAALSSPYISHAQRRYLLRALEAQSKDKEEGE